MKTISTVLVWLAAAAAPDASAQEPAIASTPALRAHGEFSPLSVANIRASGMCYAEKLGIKVTLPQVDDSVRIHGFFIQFFGGS